MSRPPKNIAASNRAKLLNLSRETGQSFQELVQYFAMGRFFYRLAVSDVSSQFTLKGAMLLHARHVTQARSTLDINLLGRMDNGQEAVHQAIDQILRQPVDDDGLTFLPDSIVVSEITKEGLSDSPIFSEEFALLPNKQTQWAAFRRKRAIQEAPQDFATIACETLAFLKPCFQRVKRAME